MNDIEEINIENKIYEIRGKQVMLDSDLAKLYKCANGTKDINKAVKRNIERFPENFMFELTSEEYNSLRFQFGTLKNGRGQHAKYNPHVFTEEGVAMLSSVLHTDRAIKTSIAIMNAFVKMRKYFSYNNEILVNHENRLLSIEKTLDGFREKKNTNDIYYSGEIYDAYSAILNIFKEAKNRIIIIDNYADKGLLDIIRNLKVEVIIITRKNNLLKELDIEKYNKQYHNLKVVYNNTYHDRYFILDSKTVYHCGASINRIGYKTFSINIISDKETYDSFINKVNKLL